MQLLVPPAKYDSCPLCGGRVAWSCRCPINHRSCAQGHIWHWDYQTGGQIIDGWVKIPLRFHFEPGFSVPIQ